MHVQEGSVADAPLIFMGLRCGAHIDDMYQVCRSSASAQASRSAPAERKRSAPHNRDAAHPCCPDITNDSSCAEVPLLALGCDAALTPTCIKFVTPVCNT